MFDKKLKNEQKRGLFSPPPPALKATTLKAPFGWVGGKSKLAKTIVERMPEHRLYVEVFGGALSVLYAKPIQTSDRYIEVVNDLNSELINLHQIIKNRPESLRNVLNNLLHSRELFEMIKRGDLKPKNNIERAAFYYFRLIESFASKCTHFAKPKSRAPKNIYRSFNVYSERLRRVCIENLDFRKLIKEYDRDYTLFYVDPPYVGTENYYKNIDSFGIDEHKDLHRMLSGIQGKFILSYNDCEFVRELYKGFRFEETEVRYTLNMKSSGERGELLIYNF